MQSEPQTDFRTSHLLASLSRHPIHAQSQPVKSDGKIKITVVQFPKESLAGKFEQQLHFGFEVAIPILEQLGLLLQLGGIVFCCRLEVGPHLVECGNHRIDLLRVFSFWLCG